MKISEDLKMVNAIMALGNKIESGVDVSTIKFTNCPKRFFEVGVAKFVEKESFLILFEEAVRAKFGIKTKECIIQIHTKEGDYFRI